jgi:uncharacterized DUF497 family protein
MTPHANGFDWDKGNRAKCERHGLSVSAVESLFTRPLAILPDAAHSERERAAFVPSAERKRDEAYSSCLRFGAKVTNC